MILKLILLLFPSPHFPVEGILNQIGHEWSLLSHRSYGKPNYPASCWGS